MGLLLNGFEMRYNLLLEGTSKNPFYPEPLR
jgi:hypothetical protein